MFKNKIIKFITLLMLFVCVLTSATACGDDSKGGDSDADRTATVASTEDKQDASEEEVTTTEKVTTTQETTTTEEITTTEKVTTTEKSTKEKKTTAKTTAKKTQKTTAKKKKVTTAQKKEASVTCSIDCKNVLSNRDSLTTNYKIPSGGMIVSKKSFKIEDGDTVLSVLRKTGVSIDVDGGDYVAGIDGLYEFDCGKNSGWMYSVNGKYPNVSAKDYKLKNGDKIKWSYTCNYGDL